MDKPYKVAFAVVLAVMAVVFIGCGSDSGSDGETTAAITKVVFIKKGDQICKDNYSKREKLLVELNNKYFKGKKNPPPQAQQEEILVDQIMPIFQEESQELHQLPLPDEGAEQAEAILTSLDEAIKRVEENPARSLTKGTEVEFKEAEQLAHKFGFEYCGRS